MPRRKKNDTVNNSSSVITPNVEVIQDPTIKAVNLIENKAAFVQACMKLNNRKAYLRVSSNKPGSKIVSIQYNYGVVTIGNINTHKVINVLSWTKFKETFIKPSTYLISFEEIEYV